MKTLDQSLLNEELKRHKRLVEYTFYVGEDDDLPVAGKDEDGKELILQAEPETDEEPAKPGIDPNPADAPAGEEAPAPEVQVGGGEETPPEGGAADAFGGGEDTGAGDEFGGEMPPEAGAPEPFPTEPAEDEVDIDVTQLVQGTEEAKQMAQANGQKMEELLSQFNQLSANLSKMDVISKKIEDLEHEVEKRNPTPQEKLEMRSLDSYPYNLKLTDFWAQKDGNYDILGSDTEPKEKEYVLTHDDANSGFNHGEVKKSFDEYEEEDAE